MRFHVGECVRVTIRWSMFYGRIGTVAALVDDDACLVVFDCSRVALRFDHSSLEHADSDDRPESEEERRAVSDARAGFAAGERTYSSDEVHATIAAMRQRQDGNDGGEDE